METILKTFQLTQADALMIPVGAILFFILWKSLERLLIAPYLRLIEAREEATSGAITEAKSMIEEASALESKFEDTVMNARIEAIKVRLEKLSQAKKSASEIVTKAEAEASQTIDDARARIQKEVNDIRAKSASEIDRMAEDAATSLLKEGPRNVVQ